jgi:hypothetical protein
MGDSVADDRFNDEQRAGLTARQFDQDRTLAAMHSLEAALAEAAPGREKGWRGSVIDALVVLGHVTTEEAENADRPDSLLSDLARTQPRLRNRVRGVRLQYRKQRDDIASIRSELEGHSGETLDVSDVRQRLGWLLTALRHQRARESDLIYEAYFEAFKAELTAEDKPGDD